MTARGPGPRVPVTGGTAYWSQDSATRVLTAGDPIVAVEVRWPDGTAGKFDVPEGAAELVLRRDAPPVVVPK
ncbi:MAG: hypothetical protein HKO57_06675 [Akkermansiaceae bacterium]|nr:hypothetical protein [Akkermansiaceae bacterium]